MHALFPDFEFVYADAEFSPEDPTPSGLVSLALVTRTDSLYLVNAETDGDLFCSVDFRREHIWSKLPLTPSGKLNHGEHIVVPYSEIRRRVAEFFHRLSGGLNSRRTVGFIADHCTQDMQRLHNLFGNDWGTMPKSIPRRPLVDLSTLEDLAGVRDGHLPDGTPVPENPEDRAHHALYDALWDREMHEFLMLHSRAVRVASGVERLES